MQTWNKMQIRSAQQTFFSRFKLMTVYNVPNYALQFMGQTKGKICDMWQVKTIFYFPSNREGRPTFSKSFVSML